jgi:hypothetical protein
VVKACNRLSFSSAVQKKNAEEERVCGAVLKRLLRVTMIDY